MKYCLIERIRLPLLLRYLTKIVERFLQRITINLIFIRNIYTEESLILKYLTSSNISLEDNKSMEFIFYFITNVFITVIQRKF